VPVTVQVPGDGRYNVEATVVLPGGIVRTATAELLVGSGDTGLIVYMPFIILDE